MLPLLYVAEQRTGDPVPRACRVALRSLHPQGQAASMRSSTRAPRISAGRRPTAAAEEICRGNWSTPTRGSTTHWQRLPRTSRRSATRLMVAAFPMRSTRSGWRRYAHRCSRQLTPPCSWPTRSVAAVTQLLDALLAADPAERHTPEEHALVQARVVLGQGDSAYFALPPVAQPLSSSACRQRPRGSISLGSIWPPARCRTAAACAP